MTTFLRQFDAIPAAFITGASRGVGAGVALEFARRGVQVALGFREKLARAENVARHVEELGGRAILAPGDLTDQAQMRAAFETIHHKFGGLDFLILNASGGLEKNAAPNYAMRLNCDAQLQTLDLALPLLREGARVVFITSHLAHFWGENPVPDVYKGVAASKNAGEKALRARIDELKKREISLLVVSGGSVEGTITPRLLERASGQKRPFATTIEGFARVIVDAALNPNLESGATVFVGKTVA